MILPFHLVKVCGGVIFAAQGCDIHSFNSDFKHISTWKYPVQNPNESSGASKDAPQDSPAPEEPPTKRRKVESGAGSEASVKDLDQGAGSENGRPKSKKAAQYDVPANERPFVQGLYATADGRHLIAITGSDKTIWVFEHDGAGNLKQRSQRQVAPWSVHTIFHGSPLTTSPRAMPKRPCSLTLTRDNRTILSADKFGDVYALPLVPSPTATPSPAPATQPPSRCSTPSTPAAAYKPQATELTVHTKRNLKALENQKISLDRKARQQEQEQQAPQRPQFEHTLLLGHVSMLTAICVGVAAASTTTTTTNTTSGASSAGQDEARVREYIITADRDEHIRVSRGIPQAHVIEGYCLGHEDFVSRLCVAPGGKEDILISGGGDDYLFVWDWARCRLLGKAGVLEHVKGVVAGEEGANKVAVTRVFACRWEGGVGVFVIVERVPALFRYGLLGDNTLVHRETIPLPGNPLDVDAFDIGGASPRLLVALHPKTSTEVGSSSSLVALDKEEAGWRQTPLVDSLATGSSSDISETELQKILYSTESLRKLSDFD
ncbi:hypothetical protein MYCTH_2295948 [Thermothelomyces thermophilus ATCC 42464]|uniref:Uncharacterized protein n=1 Tax=Thermothelomyces thermophilus (strain ATCC 42464 / BCRC 31852 / DSM 1799) TaxID=573729 RepID=G2PZU9_THET4|nr:uncharacterized protein MYCTH_2295948 [Thermothelomyces thermophilus ATCC 42464]AEO53972.1 hypothetical protein MYCTH_2295948 [Thermothelomyces thermophilus ATCC 42464]